MHDPTLHNELLITENAQLRDQMRKLDHKQACLDARGHHRKLVTSTATSTISDLNTTVANLSDHLQHEWQRNNALRDENYNLTVSTNALLVSNRQLNDQNHVLTTENVRCRTNEAALTSTVDALQQQVQTLFQKNTDLETRANDLEPENRNLLTSLQVEQQAHRQLRDEYDILQLTNNQHETDNVNLATNKLHLQNTNTNLEHTNQKLQALVTWLEAQVPGLSTNNAQLVASNATLTRQNEYLDTHANRVQKTVDDLRKEVAKLNDWVLRLQRASREEPFSQNYHVPSNTLP